MGTPARGSLRWLRSAALTVATVGLAAVAHVSAGGHVPGVPGLSVLTLLTSLVCVLFTRRRRGLVAIASTMGAMQLVLHEGLMLLRPLGAVSCGPDLDGHALLHAGHAVSPFCAGASAAAMTGHLHGSSSVMILAHAVATVLLAAALFRGEQALWTLRGFVARALRPVTTWQPVAARRVVTLRVPVVLSAWTSVRDLVRRGPPATAVVPF
ncbi:MAG TPA: hypothetical protein VFL94_10730 [Actinomycetales bacterium]|nr:hypothetical protein [Actinomycetales bacterium]